MGIKAQIAVPEYKGRSFTATVEASARSVDVGSGTDAYAAGRRQSRRRTDGRRLRQCFTLKFRHPTKPSMSPASARFNLRSGRPACCDRRRRRPCRAQGRRRSRAITAAKSRSRPALPPTTASSRARRTGWRPVTRSASPGSRRKAGTTIAEVPWASPGDRPSDPIDCDDVGRPFGSTSSTEVRDARRKSHSGAPRPWPR